MSEYEYRVITNEDMEQARISKEGRDFIMSQAKWIGEYTWRRLLGSVDRSKISIGDAIGISAIAIDGAIRRWDRKVTDVPANYLISCCVRFTVRHIAQYYARPVRMVRECPESRVADAFVGVEQNPIDRNMVRFMNRASTNGDFAAWEDSVDVAKILHGMSDRRLAIVCAATKCGPMMKDCAAHIGVSKQRLHQIVQEQWPGILAGLRSRFVTPVP